MNTTSRKRIRKGSALGITMVMAVCLVVLGGSYLALTTSARKVNDAHYSFHALLPVAERAIDQTMSMFNKYVDDNSMERTQPMMGSDTSKSWDLVPEWKGSVSSGYRRDFGDMDLGDGRKVGLKVLMQNIPGAYSLADRNKPPYIVAEVVYKGGAGLGSATYTRQYVASLALNTSLGNGLISIKSIDLKGNSIAIDSYDSTKGPYDALNNRSDLVTVASPSMLDGAVAVGNADVYGFVATGDKVDGTNPLVNLGPNAHVYGKDSSSAYQKNGVDPNRLTQDYIPPEGAFKTDPIPSLTAGTVPLTTTTYDPSTGAATTTTTYHVPNKTALNSWTTGGQKKLTSGVYFLSSSSSSLSKGLNSAGEELVIDGDVVIYVTDASQTVCSSDLAASNFPQIKVSGNGKITMGTNATLKIYTAGNVDIGGGGVVNPTIYPGNFLISGVNTTANAQSLSLGGNNGFSGVIYAPNSTVSLGGGGNTNTTFFGSIVALTSFVNGNISFHFDEQLNEKTKPQYYLNSFTELTGTHKVTM